MPQREAAVILGAARTAIGRFQGGLAGLSAPELGAHAIRAAVARAGVAGDQIDECLIGNVIGAGLGQAPARQAAIGAGLPATVGATAINKVCGSGLKAVALARAAILAGDARLVVAGGMESMSRAPHLLPGARAGLRLGGAELADALIHDGLWCAFEHQHMGRSAEWIARAQGVERAAQDAFALESHRRALAAQAAGALDAEIVPVEAPGPRGQPASVARDEGPRADSSAEALARLRPAFEEGGSVTAGNAPGLSDGAAALVVSSASYAAAIGARPLAHILGFAQAAVAPLELFTAPVAAVGQLLAQRGGAIGDYDLVELNEAFAAQAVANARALGLDWARLNVHGGAIALGHPIGASGARVLVTLIYALMRRGGGRGLAALCLGGGEAVAMDILVDP